MFISGIINGADGLLIGGSGSAVSWLADKGADDAEANGVGACDA